MRDVEDRMQRFQWILQCVDDRVPWVYSIGLLERFEHPELVIAGVDLPVAAQLTNAVADRIARVSGSPPAQCWWSTGYSSR